VLASNVPSCVAYDPTYAYELAVIVQDGLRRMFGEQQSVFYYLTVTNENYLMPEMPKGVEPGIVRGMYPLREAGKGKGPRVQLLGSGAILREVLAAAELLQQDFGVKADVWSVTSFTELKREGEAVHRQAMLHPTAAKKLSYVEECLAARKGPIVAATDYVRAFADQIRAFVPRRYTVLGTDGFGRSDTRPMLRAFFEVDRHHVVLAALHSLQAEGEIEAKQVTEAIRKYDIDPNKIDPSVP
jgi:pyruvate dehydrogenase E1 component